MVVKSNIIPNITKYHAYSQYLTYLKNYPRQKIRDINFRLKNIIYLMQPLIFVSIKHSHDDNNKLMLKLTKKVDLHDVSGKCQNLMSGIYYHG